MTCFRPKLFNLFNYNVWYTVIFFKYVIDFTQRFTNQEALHLVNRMVLLHCSIFNLKFCPLFNYTLSKIYEIASQRLAFTLDFSPPCVHLFYFIYDTDWLEVKYYLSMANVVISETQYWKSLSNLRDYRRKFLYKSSRFF